MDSLRWTLLLIGAVIVAAIWWTGHRRSRERGESLFERARRDPGDDAGPSGLEAGQTPDLDLSTFAAHPEAETADTGTADTGTADTDVDSDAGPEAGAVPGEEERAATAVREPAAAAAADRRPAAASGRPGDSPRDAAGDEPPAPAEAERIEAVYVVAPRGERFVGSQLQELFARYELEHGEMGIFHRRDDQGHTLFSVANLSESGTFDPATMDTLSTPGVALFVRLPGPPSAELAFDRMILAARGFAEALEARLLDQQQSTLTRQTEQHLRDRMREFDHHRQRERR